MHLAKKLQPHRPTLQASLGLVATGAGLCLAIDAAIAKAAGNEWVLQGTIALVVFNSGLCLTIDAGIRKWMQRKKII